MQRRGKLGHTRDLAKANMNQSTERKNKRVYIYQPMAILNELGAVCHAGCTDWVQL
jgi:hypothetical protein